MQYSTYRTRFTLGICNCGCKASIPIESTGNRIQFFKHNHHHQKGGRIKHLGYILRLKKNLQLLIITAMSREHRLVWEEHYNAILLPWADVHHKDENKENNVWYNLQAMTHTTHCRCQKHELNYSIRYWLLKERQWEGDDMISILAVQY